jgi:hypothetical protein
LRVRQFGLLDDCEGCVVQRYRQIIVNGNHINVDSGPPWAVLWNTAMRPDGQWSTVRTQTEAAAVERATHFVKLGFVVYAIKDPSGMVVMDANAIMSRFAVAKYPPLRISAGDRAMSN